MNCMTPFTNVAPGTLRAASLICRRSSTFVWIGTSNGFLRAGVAHDVLYISVGANRMGSALIFRFARAISTALRATRTISSAVTTLLAEKPQVPSTITRIPKP